MTTPRPVASVAMRTRAGETDQPSDLADLASDIVRNAITARLAVELAWPTTARAAAESVAVDVTRLIDGLDELPASDCDDEDGDLERMLLRLHPPRPEYARALDVLRHASGDADDPAEVGGAT